MALFFDSGWFDSRLAAARPKRADVGAALRLSETELADIKALLVKLRARR
jgi:hypothetical protein